MVKKKKSEDLEQVEKRSRAKYECPPLLDEYITKANLAPFGQLPDWDFIYRKNDSAYCAENGLTETDRAGYSKVLQATIDECLAGRSETFIQYIHEMAASELRYYMGTPHFKPEDEELAYRSFIKEAYRDFCQLQQDLKAYADYFTNWRKYGMVTIGKGGTYGANGKVIGLPTPQAYFVKVDTKEGTRTPIEASGLSKALSLAIGERVRSCEVCSNIFWAKRKETETCSPRCFNNLRVRRYRNLTPEEKAERKARREANRNLIKNEKAKPTKRSK